MRKRLSLLAIVLLITACTPAFPEIIEPSKTLDVEPSAQIEASPTAAVEEQSNPKLAEHTETFTSNRLLPSSELQSYCVPWLEETPSPSSSIRLENGIKEGDSAVDFSLKDIYGETHHLSDLLESKPVMLILGGYT